MGTIALAAQAHAMSGSLAEAAKLSLPAAVVIVLIAGMHVKVQPSKVDGLRAHVGGP